MGALVDRHQRFSHRRVQPDQRALQGIDHLQVQPQNRSVVISDCGALMPIVDDDYRVVDALVTCF